MPQRHRIDRGCVENCARTSRASYHKEWDRNYQKPGASSVALAFFIRVLPKVGPLKVLSFEAPVAQAEQRFEDSFDRTRDLY